MSHTFLNLAQLRTDFLQLRKNICIAYKRCGAKVNMCCRFYEVVVTVSEKLCDRLTLKFVEI